MSEQLYDVIEVRIKPPHDERMISEAKTKENAEAIVNYAVMRRGVETAFFTIEPHPHMLKPTLKK